MFFRKKQGKNTPVEQPTEQQIEQNNQPQKRGFFSRAVDGVRDGATKVKKKAQRAANRARKIKVIFDVITTLFFIGNSLYWVFSKWGEFGPLLWVMLAVTVAYILVFVVSIITHSKNKQQMSMDNKKFKVHLKLWKALANLLFIAMSGLTLAQNLLAWQSNGDITTLSSMIFSGFVLFFKLISTISKLFKLNKKRKKLNKKQRKLKDQNHQLQLENEQ